MSARVACVRGDQFPPKPRAEAGREGGSQDKPGCLELEAQPHLPAQKLLLPWFGCLGERSCPDVCCDSSLLTNGSSPELPVLLPSVGTDTIKML